jgi:hypothetical protein
MGGGVGAAGPVLSPERGGCRQDLVGELGRAGPCRDQHEQTSAEVAVGPLPRGGQRSDERLEVTVPEQRGEVQCGLEQGGVVRVASWPELHEPGREPLCRLLLPGQHGQAVAHPIQREQRVAVAP